MPQQTGTPRFYNRKEAAQYLRERWGQRTSAKTLAKWACQGGGPTFSYAGRFPIYAQTDLDEFARKRIRGPFGSTTEAMASVCPRDFQRSRIGSRTARGSD